MRKLIVSNLLLIMFLVGAASGFLVSNVGWWGMNRSARDMDHLYQTGADTLKHVALIEKALLRCQTLFLDALKQQYLTSADTEALRQVQVDMDAGLALLKAHPIDSAQWQQINSLHDKLVESRAQAIRLLATDIDAAYRHTAFTILPLQNELRSVLQAISDQAIEQSKPIYERALDANRDARFILLAMSVLASLFFCVTAWLTYREAIERRTKTAQLDQERTMFRTLFEASNDGVILMENDRVIDLNRAAMDLFALSSPGAAMGQGIDNLQPLRQPDDTSSADALRAHIASATLSGSWHGDWQFKARNGREFPAELAIDAARLGERKMIQLTIRDISIRKEAEISMRLANHAFENSLEGIAITDQAGNILTINGAFTAITGYTMEEVVGRNPSLLSSGRQTRDFYDKMWQAIDAHGKWQGEIWNIRKNGEIYPQWLNISRVTDERGRLTNYVGVFSDISERKSAEERILHQVYYDQLTDLPNRVLFSDRLNQVMTLAKRRSDFHFAVMFLDLDRFKLINDSMGHDAGDQLLRQAAHRLRGSIRESDTVARMGGDEFTIVLSEISNPKDAANVAQKILDAFRPPFKLNGEDVFVSVSIGASIYPDDGASTEALLKNADMAMYRAKSAGGSWFELYDEGLGSEAASKMALQTALHKALERDEFELLYQPQFDCDSGKLVGFESLLRWHHPERGMLEPESFLSAAEDSGIIVAIGAWVLRTACAQAQQWREDFPGHRTMAVNLSAREFHSPELTRQVQRALAVSGLPHFCLELEVAEGTVMQNLDASIAIMQRLANLGVRFSIDRFGTGHSSLAYLRKLPLHALKIDKSFVHDVVTDADDAAIVSAMVAMAHKLGLRVVAQHIEDKHQLALLKPYKGMVAQGSLLGAPVDAAAASALIAAGCPKTAFA